MHSQQRIIKLIQADPLRVEAIKAVSSLKLPDWLIAAGFVRNLVWDSVFFTSSVLNDIDVIYYCARDKSEERDEYFEQKLRHAIPKLPWSVKNQARMHTRNKHSAYKSTFDAMSYWPEKQTSIGTFVSENGAMQIKHCFELNYQFNGRVDFNPKSRRDIFIERHFEKAWDKRWPGLIIEALD